jgi:thiol-disulfide isomerase/thioredoxin
MNPSSTFPGSSRGGSGAGGLGAWWRTAGAGRAVPEMVLALVAAGGLLLSSGCASPEAPTAAAVAQTLSFSGKTIDGAAFDAATMAGKPTLLWFWAPWCATCASEAQSVNDLVTEYGDRLGVLGIAGMGNNKDMHQFVSDLAVHNVNLDDQAGVVWKRFGITQQSTYVLIDRTGTVRTTGYLDDLQLTDKVKSLVA